MFGKCVRRFFEEKKTAPGFFPVKVGGDVFAREQVAKADWQQAQGNGTHQQYEGMAFHLGVHL